MVNSSTSQRADHYPSGFFIHVMHAVAILNIIEYS
jgi:hypothetical protein